MERSRIKNKRSKSITGKKDGVTSTSQHMNVNTSSKRLFNSNQGQPNVTTTNVGLGKNESDISLSCFDSKVNYP